MSKTEANCVRVARIQLAGVRLLRGTQIDAAWLVRHCTAQGMETQNTWVFVAQTKSLTRAMTRTRIGREEAQRGFESHSSPRVGDEERQVTRA